MRPRNEGKEDAVLPIVLTGVVELGQTPVDESQLPLLVVDHDIMRLHISVHDTIRVTKVQGFQQFEHIIANIVISQSRVESFEVRIVDVFENEGGSLRLGITHNI